MLAIAAILFVLASAIVAFHGWPRIASQNAPAAVQITPAPASATRVSRRLRAVVLPRRIPPAAVAPRGGARTVAPGARSAEAQVPSPSAPHRGSASERGVSRPGAGSRAPGNSGEIAVATPSAPPVTVSVPTRTIRPPAQSVVKKVAGTVPAG